MTTTLPTTSEHLSSALKEQTATAHADAENSRFMAKLGEGDLDRDAVAELTLQYFHIYSALEAAVRRAAEHPAVALIADPRLERVHALAEDLTAMTGAGWHDVTPLAATQRYVSEDALHFYDFSVIGKIPPYRAQYKAALDAMNFTEDERTRLINTAKHVFDLNQAVFTDLAAARGLN